MDDYKTLREVTIGIRGIRNLLHLYGGVFGAVVVLAAAVTGFVYHKIDAVETATTRMEAKLETIEKILGEVRDNTKSAALQPTGPAKEAMVITGVSGSTLTVQADFLGPYIEWDATKVYSPVEADTLLQGVGEGAWLFTPKR